MAVNRLSPAQRLLIVFILTIFAPGMLLAIFGARALWQERRLAESQLRDRLDHGAEAAIRVLSDELGKLQALLDDDASTVRIVRSLPEDGSWAYVEHLDDGRRVYPANVLPYELSVPVYTASAEPGSLETKHRQARALREAGRADKAAAIWTEIERSNGRIGSLPADLVAGFELSAADADAAKRCHRNLIDGRWRLEKARYLYYLSEIRKRLGQEDVPDKRLRFAEAVESAASSASRLIESDGGAYIALRREAPLAILVLTSDFLKARIWPKLEAAPDSDLRVAGIWADSVRMYSAPAVPAAPQTTRTLEHNGVGWNVAIQLEDAPAFYAAINRKTNLYLAMLSLVVISLASGGYFVARTVRRELEVARMKSEFVSTVSHEFRSPLTGIRQLGEMLARDRVTDESKRRQYYELIVHESERLARLVENVLDFSRMEAGRKQYRFEPLNTAAWLSSIAADFQIEASRSGYELQAQIPADLPPISGDREALTTAVRNLLDNACKYSAESKSIWLDAEPAAGGIRVRVRDRGVGIPAGELRQIFEKFYRGERLANRVKGVGLGLNLVQHIVAAHRGEVQVESREGEGSTFSILLRGAS